MTFALLGGGAPGIPLRRALPSLASLALGIAQSRCTPPGDAQGETPFGVKVSRTVSAPADRTGRDASHVNQNAEREAGDQEGTRFGFGMGPEKDGARRAGGLEGAVRPPGLVRRMLQPLMEVSCDGREGCVKDRALGVKIT